MRTGSSDMSAHSTCRHLDGMCFARCKYFLYEAGPIGIPGDGFDQAHLKPEYCTAGDFVDHRNVDIHARTHGRRDRSVHVTLCTRCGDRREAALLPALSISPFESVCWRPDGVLCTNLTRKRRNNHHVGRVPSYDVDSLFKSSLASLGSSS